jgi:cytochrome c biogenesis protein ResB
MIIKMKEQIKERSEFARWSFKHACLSAAIAAVAVLGYRFGIMNYQVALIILIGGAALGMMAILSAVVSILAIITSVDTKVTGAQIMEIQDNLFSTYLEEIVYGHFQIDSHFDLPPISLMRLDSPERKAVIASLDKILSEELTL